MILKIIILITFLLSGIPGSGQGCTELLSKAEQDYRDGRFIEIKQRLCRCFGAYQDKDDDTITIRPRRMRIVLEAMKAADEEYAAQLGVFRGYWKEFITDKHHYDDSVSLFFSVEERYRAYLLLSKLYQYLGVLRLADFFAVRAAMMFPDSDLEAEGLSFTKLFESQRRRVAEFSIGPLIGWSYAFAVSQTNYRGQESEYQYQSDGKVVLGCHFSHRLSPSLSLNMNFWFHGTRIVYYTEARSGNRDSQIDFYHLERQGWIKFPLLIKWSPPNHFYWLRNQELWKTKIFVAAGISANYFMGSNATIIDLASNTLLNEYNTTGTRNRFNSDFVLQILTRFQLGQNYINIGFTGTHSLNNILNDNLVRSPHNQLYNKYGIVENNYKLVGGFWTVTYEFRIKYLKRLSRLEKETL